MNVMGSDLHTLFGMGVMGTLSDGQLLDRFVEGQEGAVFEAIVLRHGPMVWGVCRRILRDHHDAEDAFQATFLVLARRAASVMPREKVGNWLYGVAYQTAMKAMAMRTKRRLRESQVSDMPEPEVASHDPRDELAESLDGELSRLPEKYRTPIVLCDLEGRSHKEVASQLGWPIGTVSSRLSRARAMLAKRLTRRGRSLSGGSLAVLLAQESASAAMPTRLVVSTAQAASLIAAGGVMSAGPISAGVATLTGEVMKMMLLGKLKIGVVMLLVASAIAACGTGLALQAQMTEPGQEDELQRLSAEKALVLAGSQDAAVPKNAGLTGARTVLPQASQHGATKADGKTQLVSVVGRVVDPDGRPVAGAKLYLAESSPPAAVRATTGSDGHFEFKADSRELNAPDLQGPAATPRLVALAEGFGLGFGLQLDKTGSYSIRLAPEFPVEGRILDTEGRPAAGARVQVVSLAWSAEDDLTRFREALIANEGAYPSEHRLLKSWSSLAVGELLPATATNADGGFTLRGIGRERIVGIQIAGRGIRTTIASSRDRTPPSACQTSRPAI
jgi:RNA polymerase sigma factor (sigma-70 family)